MSFEIDKIESNRPTTLIAEHETLLKWMTRNPRRAVPEYLNERVIDRLNRIAVYYIRGIGMGDGRAFAMVQNNEVIHFDVMRRVSNVAGILQPLNVSAVVMPERLSKRRLEYTQFIKDALIAYQKEHATAFWLPAAAEVSFEKTRWEVVPQRYSKLYWKTKTTGWWNKSYKLRKNTGSFLQSPILALFVFLTVCSPVLFGISVPIWILVLAGSWLSLRLTQFDDEYFYWHWFVGRPKLKNPMLSIGRSLQRVTEPIPLSGVTVFIECKTNTQMECEIEIKNTSLYFVRYLSISSMDIADILAAGYTKAMREEMAGALDAAKLEAVFPSIEVKWILPRQSVIKKISLPQGYSSENSMKQIKAIVKVPKRMSREPKGVVRAYFLPVIFRNSKDNPSS